MKTITITYLAREVLIIENDRILSIPYIEIKTIVYDKPYIVVATMNKKYQLAQNLSTFCVGLPPFIKQIDKSTYINLLQVTAIQKKGCVYKADIQSISYPIARRRISKIKESFVNIKTGSVKTDNCHICIKCKFAV